MVLVLDWRVPINVVEYGLMRLLGYDRYNLGDTDSIGKMYSTGESLVEADENSATGCPGSGGRLYVTTCMTRMYLIPIPESIA